MAMRESGRTKLSEAQSEALAALGPRFRGVRRQSDYVFLGLPLYSIALGPDPEKGELRGHARGVVAIGDIASGIVALGGLAFGFIAVGGVAFGLLAFGGGAVGLLLAIGGAAIGCVAAGGAALGLVAVGGAAAGYYAAGGAAFGKYVVDAVHRSPEALEFFAQWGWLQGAGLLPPQR